MAKRKKQASGISKALIIIVGIIVIAILSGYYFLKKDIVEPVQQNMTTAEGKARDATRKAALRTYLPALEIYKSQNGSYSISTTCTPPQDLNLEIGNPPIEPFRDPSFSKQDSNWPEFCYQSDSKGTKFTVWAKLESSGDDKTSQINTTSYFSIPSGFEPNYYFMQSEE